MSYAVTLLASREIPTRTEDQVVDAPHVREHAGYLVRPGQVEAEAPGRAYLLGHAVGPVRVAPGEHHLVAAPGAVPGDPPADPGHTADDDDAAHGFPFRIPGCSSGAPLPQGLPQVLPVPGEPVRVARRRLRRLCLQPTHRLSPAWEKP